MNLLARILALTLALAGASICSAQSPPYPAHPVRIIVPFAPGGPTIGEAGFAGQEADTLLGVLVPAGTPKDIVAYLHREIARIVALADVKERLDAIGFVPVANTPDEFAAVIKAETTRWGKVIKDANLRAE